MTTGRSRPNSAPPKAERAAQRRRDGLAGQARTGRGGGGPGRLQREDAPAGHAELDGLGVAPVEQGGVGLEEVGGDLGEVVGHHRRGPHGGDEEAAGVLAGLEQVGAGRRAAQEQDHAGVHLEEAAGEHPVNEWGSDDRSTAGALTGSVVGRW